MMPFWWKYAVIGVAILGLGLWIESLRLTIANDRTTIQEFQSATLLAQQKAKEVEQADAAKAKEISDANSEQVGSMARYISALLVQHKPGVPAAADHQAPGASLADAGAGRQPGGGDHPSADHQAVCSGSDSAAVLGTALLGWEQVRDWRRWAATVK